MEEKKKKHEPHAYTQRDRERGEEISLSPSLPLLHTCTHAYRYVQPITYKFLDILFIACTFKLKVLGVS